MKLKAWALSDMGNVRTNNEDSYCADAEHGVFVVADGVGGRERGEVASTMVAAAAEAAAPNFERVAAEADPKEDPEHRERVLDLVRRHLQQVNADIFSKDTSRDDSRGMATTTDLLLISRGSAYVGHVGDSRVYLIRDDKIFRITEDHTYAEMLRRDDRSEVRALADQERRYEHMLTRSMGTKPHVEVDTLFLDVQPGDRFILCSDGLTDYLGGSELLAFSREYSGQQLVEALVEEAKDRGGRDNITVVVAEVIDEPDTVRSVEPKTIDTIRQVSFLEQIELFDGLEALELIKILRTVYERPFGDGDVVIREGEKSEALYLIVEGGVSLSVKGTEIAELQAGQHFGELALFARDNTRSATATCVGPTLLLAVPADKFRKLTTDEPTIGNKLMRNLLTHAADQIRAMNARLAGDGPEEPLDMAHADTIDAALSPGKGSQD